MTELFQAGETVRITAIIIDVSGAAADPTTVTISIRKPDGTMDITDAAMSSAVSGTYYYDYLIATDIGIYNTSVTATGTAGRITIEPGSIMVGVPI